MKSVAASVSPSTLFGAPSGPKGMVKGLRSQLRLRSRQPFKSERIRDLRAGAQLCEEFPAQIPAVLNGEHVIQFGELSLDLFQARFIRDEQQHAARGPLADRHADDRLEIEPAAGKQTGDVRHGARMVAHPQLKHGGGRGGCFVI